MATGNAAAQLPPYVLIVSADADFYPVLAEQLQLQLGYKSQQIHHENDIKQYIDSCNLIVTDLADVTDACTPLIKCTQKPLRLQDLLAEIEAVVQKANSPEIWQLAGVCELHIRQKQLLHVPSGKTADVTDKEMQLLQALLEAGDAVISREAMLKELWGYDETVDTHTLETHIYRLRSKIKDITGSDGMIEAVGGGYKLTSMQS